MGLALVLALLAGPAAVPVPVPVQVSAPAAVPRAVPPARPPAVRTADARLVLVGDSVTEMLGPGHTDTARQVLGAAGWSVVVDTLVGRSIGHGASTLRARWGEVGDVVVVQLGANDGGDAGVLAQRLGALVAGLDGVERVVLVGYPEDDPDRAAVNAAILDVALRDPRVVIADWRAVAARNPGLVAGDGLHLTPAGARALARVILLAVGPAPGTAAPRGAARGPTARAR